MTLAKNDKNVVLRIFCRLDRPAPEPDGPASCLPPGRAASLATATMVTSSGALCAAVVASAATTAVATAAVPVGVGPAVSGPAAAAANWTLTFADDFDGAALNPAHWDAWDNRSHCCPQELQLYVKDAVSVADGFLSIRTDRTPQPVLGPAGAPFSYSSGWVETANHFAQRHGRFEANMSLPSAAHSGIWPAFWMKPNSTQCWPTGGEIDVMEFVGNPLGEAADRVFGSYHWQRNQTACREDMEPVPGAPWPPLWKVAGKDWQTDFHVYGVEWTEDSLSFYVDGGDPYLVRRGGDGPGEVYLPTAPMYMILNQGVNPDLFPPGHELPYDNVVTRVDWVRVYAASD